MELLAPGGALFIGDVRNHTLQSAFQTGDRSCARATTTADAAEIRQRVRRAMVSETELLLAPEFFTTWAADQPSVAGVDIQLKRGCGRQRTQPVPLRRRHPQGARAGALAGRHTQLDVGRVRGPPGLQHRLVAERPAAVRITDIPRAGRDGRRRLEQALAAGRPLTDARRQRRHVPTPSPPNRCTVSAKTTGYHVAVTWGTRPGTLDAVFIATPGAQQTRR